MIIQEYIIITKKKYKEDDKMKIIMNGDIYIKREPYYVEYSFEELELQNMKIDLETEKIKEIREAMIEYGKNELKLSGNKLEEYILSLNESCDKKYKELEKKKLEINEKGKPIFDGYNSFWTLSYNENNIKMIEQEASKATKTYKTIEDMEKDFISLREVLSTAQFEGRQFGIGLRISETFCISIQPKNTPIDGPILTHCYGDRGIVYIPYDMDIDNIPKKEGYELVDLRDFLSNVSRISKVIREDFNNPPEIYQKIFEQIYNKEKGKEYIK